MNRLKKNDYVIVIAGKNKGSKGTLISFINKFFVIIEGVNLVKKHIKSNPNKQIEGGIVEQEAPIHVSNVALYNNISKKPDRIGYTFLENKSKKVRFFKSNKEYLD